MPADSWLQVEDLIKGGYMTTDTAKDLITDQHFGVRSHRKPIQGHHTGVAAAPARREPSPPPADSDSDDNGGFDGDDPEQIKWGHWQLEREQVEILHKIGEGEFGEASHPSLYYIYWGGGWGGRRCLPEHQVMFCHPKKSTSLVSHPLIWLSLLMSFSWYPTRPRTHVLVPPSSPKL